MKQFNFPGTSFLLIFAILISFSACSVFNSLSNVKKPDLSIADVSITNLSLKDIELTFDVDINNPNPVAVNLTDYTYDFQLNEKSFVKGAQDTGMEVEAPGSSRVQVPVSFSYNELYEMFSGLKGQDETTYVFNFNAGINAPVLGRFEIPLTKSGSIPIVKMPRINVKNVELENLSFTKADIAVNLIIDNPNSFDLTFSELNYNLKLNNSSPLSGAIAEKIQVGKSSETTVSIPLSLNILELGSAIRSMLKEGNEIEYDLTGSSRVGSSLSIFSPSIFSFDKAGKVNIHR